MENSICVGDVCENQCFFFSSLFLSSLGESPGKYGKDACFSLMWPVTHALELHLCHVFHLTVGQEDTVTSEGRGRIEKSMCLEKSRELLGIIRSQNICLMNK